MRTVIALVLVLPMALPAAAQGRMGADNPWFQDFERDCRVGDDAIQAQCETGVLQGYEAVSGKSGVSCDWAAFWAEAERLDSDIFRVLPWQNGVEEIFQAEGVCQGS